MTLRRRSATAGACAASGGRGRRLVPAATAAVVALVAVAFASAAPSRPIKRSTACTPVAYTPWVDASTRTGYSIGTTTGDCPIAGSGGYYVDIQLKNLSGGTLDEKIYSAATGNPIFQGRTVSCAGANVHTFLYIQVNGQGASDTSGNNSNCTY